MVLSFLLIGTPCLLIILNVVADIHLIKITEKMICIFKLLAYYNLIILNTLIYLFFDYFNLY
ncbi:hypothetical protein TCT1_17690 [Xenorhabdus sp. TCT-1]|uniref:Uncharacterized protein n=1 Tax=Xenorhabdus taiwanensis TaxID=3085177 RepID=A0ABM8JVW5_9GAMM|nr:hypothetical protein TCT1_17690 [Xenorhabdus sp. TCT-1]